MTLKITTKDEDVMVVVSLEGRLVLGQETNDLRAKVKALLSEGKKNIVLSLLNVTFIDSSGIGVLVAAHASAKSAGAALQLCDLGPRFSELMQVTKLFTIFEIYDSEHEAYRALSSKASKA